MMPVACARSETITEADWGRPGITGTIFLNFSPAHSAGLFASKPIYLVDWFTERAIRSGRLLSGFRVPNP
jgi:hypothetical protein